MKWATLNHQLDQNVSLTAWLFSNVDQPHEGTHKFCDELPDFQNVFQSRSIKRHEGRAYIHAAEHIALDGCELGQETPRFLSHEFVSSLTKSFKA